MQTPYLDPNANLLALLHNAANRAEDDKISPHALMKDLWVLAKTMVHNHLRRSLIELSEELPDPSKDPPPGMYAEFAKDLRKLAKEQEDEIRDKYKKAMLRIKILAPDDFCSSAAVEVLSFQNELRERYHLDKVADAFAQQTLTDLQNGVTNRNKTLRALALMKLEALLVEARSDIEEVKDNDTEDSQVGVPLPKTEEDTLNPEDYPENSDEALGEHPDDLLESMPTRYAPTVPKSPTTPFAMPTPHNPPLAPDPDPKLELEPVVAEVMVEETDEVDAFTAEVETWHRSAAAMLVGMVSIAMVCVLYFAVNEIYEVIVSHPAEISVAEVLQDAEPSTDPTPMPNVVTTPEPPVPTRVTFKDPGPQFVELPAPTGAPIPCRGAWATAENGTALVSLASGIWWLNGVNTGEDGSCLLATGPNAGSVVRMSCLDPVIDALPATNLCPAIQKM